MATQPDNTSTAAQPGSVSGGRNHQALAEPSNLSRDRVSAYKVDNVILKASEGTTDSAQSIDQHRARAQHLLGPIETQLQGQHGGAQPSGT